MLLFRGLSALILFTATTYHAGSQPKLLEDSLFFPSVGRPMPFRVYLPENPSGTMPVLLLLHGYGGSQRDWSESTDLWRCLDSLSVVVAMPQADTSWYVDAVSAPDARYETYIIREFLPAILTRYGGDSGSVGIAGVSMGGYGALILGLRHPDVFRFVGALSGSLDIPFGIPDLDRNGRTRFRPSLERAFGIDTTTWAALCPYRLVLGMDPGVAPYIYLANGIQDDFYSRMEYYRAFVHLLWMRNLRYEYHESPGRHDWLYWGSEVKPLLRSFLETLQDRKE